LNLTVLPIYDRGKISLEDFQLTFKRFIALKLFDSVSRVTSCKFSCFFFFFFSIDAFPFVAMHFTVDYINENIEIWESMKEKDHQKELDPATTNDVIEEEKMVTPNRKIPSQQPPPQGKSTTSQRPRSGI
jgi:hypothetical protein